MININFSRCEVEKRENRTRNFRVWELHEVPNAKLISAFLRRELHVSKKYLPLTKLILLKSSAGIFTFIT